jgi:hypothetical protein
MENKMKISNKFLSAILIVLIAYGFLPTYGQTLRQEYEVKYEYKDSKPFFDLERKIVRIFGKDYRMEESYFRFKYAVLKNGDYVCMVDEKMTWEYMEQVCREENRYKVHIGNNPYNERGYSHAIWILRKD